MRKKDYELIAEALKVGMVKAELMQWQGNRIVARFANALAEENPRFDEVKFFRACGL